MASSVFPIIGGVQSYDWGKLGSTSKAAQYAALGLPGFTIDEQKPYAELWMGTHPTLPSHLGGTSEPLGTHLAQHPELIGSKILQAFPDAKHGHLPFLFKVLAIRKALSIQAHPDKPLAEKLHRERPNLYKDPNHKPEMAIALTPFTALCGFRPFPEIATYLSTVPEFAGLIPPSIITTFQSHSSLPASSSSAKVALRDVFSALMTAPSEQVRTNLSLLVGRYRSGGLVQEEKDVSEWVVKLNEQFEGDIGVFCVFVLNVVKLNPGEAIFLGAGEPHAYLEGDIVETMATSDNVLRAGLTPKPRDVPNLITSLTYSSSPPSAHLIRPTSSSLHTLLYEPPIPEFSVSKMALLANEHEKLSQVDGPSILIVTRGAGRIGVEGVREGSVIFVGAGVNVGAIAGEEGIEAFRAFVEA